MPIIEAGFCRHSLLAEAWRLASGRFRVNLQISDLTDYQPPAVYRFARTFDTADEALRHALAFGRDSVRQVDGWVA